MTARRLSPEQRLFEEIISPVSFARFLREHWEQSLMLVQGRPADKYAEILTIDSIDRTLASCKIPPTHIDLGRDSASIAKTEFCSGNDVDLDRVLSLHRQGATIILRAFHEWSWPVQSLRRMFEAVFECPVQVNVYLTPPGGQSTPAHFDTHDIFILQIEGAKHWRMWQSSRRLPLHDEYFDKNKHPVGSTESDITLQPGDLLYMPRGAVHEPRTTTSYSIHISVGVVVATWADLLAATVREASLTNVALRSSPPLTAGGWIRKPRRLVREIRKRIAMLDRAAAASAAEHAAIRFVETRSAQSLGRLVEAASPQRASLDWVVGRRLGVIFRISREESGIRLESRKAQWTAPLSAEPALSAIALADTIRASDIPGLDDASKLDLVNRLINAGFLERKREPAETALNGDRKPRKARR